jgi:helix-turn-helix protein
MGEVGARLRDERERRGIGIDEIEAETRIRAKFLLAIEEERFDTLPGPAYVRAFVRDYAEQLGLDPQSFLNDLNDRPDLTADVVMVPPRQVADVPLLDRRMRTAAIVAGAVLVLLLSAAGAYLVSRGGSGGGAAGQTGSSQPRSQTAPQTTQPAGGSTAATPPPATTAHRAQVVLTATRGDVWLSVRAGSATGALLFQNTLPMGHRLRFHHRRLWMRVGAPWNLAITAAGKPLTVPLQAIGDLLVTPAGARATA